MSLTSMLMNMNASTSSKSNSGYIKLPADEHLFSIWKLKVEAIIRGAGLIEVLEYDQNELHAKALARLNVWCSLNL